MKVYLRETSGGRSGASLEIFSGDIEKDREYWRRHQKLKARYFELKKETKSK